VLTDSKLGSVLPEPANTAPPLPKTTVLPSKRTPSLMVMLVV
jgi:hypothetical protein